MCEHLVPRLSVRQIASFPGSQFWQEEGLGESLVSTAHPRTSPVPVVFDLLKQKGAWQHNMQTQSLLLTGCSCSKTCPPAGPFSSCLWWSPLAPTDSAPVSAGDSLKVVQKEILMHHISPNSNQIAKQQATSE